MTEQEKRTMLCLRWNLEALCTRNNVLSFSSLLNHKNNLEMIKTEFFHFMVKAVSSNSYKITKHILENYESYIGKSDSAITYYAAGKGSIKLIRLLLRYGIKLNINGSLSNSLYQENQKMIKFLLNTSKARKLSYEELDEIINDDIINVNQKSISLLIKFRDRKNGIGSRVRWWMA